jgi:putative glycosyltransferase (TIGR04372 family)
MTKYIFEVGNLSLHEVSAIEHFIAQTNDNIEQQKQALSFSLDMVDQLKQVGQEKSAAIYDAQIEIAKSELISSYIYLGHCWTYFGDTFQSTDAYQAALSFDENCINAITFLGRNLLEVGKFEEARDLLKRGEAISPNDPMLLYYLGESFFRLSKMEEAETRFLATLDAFPATTQNDAPAPLKDSNRWKKFAGDAIEGLSMVSQWRSAIQFGPQVERDLARLEKIADGRPIYITHMCGKGWILSHMVNQIEVFVRYLKLDGVEDPLIIILNADEFCNSSLVEIYEREICLIDSRYPRLRKRLINLREWLKVQGSPIAADIDPHNPHPHAVNYFKTQLRCWTDAPQTLSLTASEEAKGKEVLKDVGVENSEFVCFGIRETSYYKKTWLEKNELKHYWQSNINLADDPDDEELGAINILGGEPNVWYQRSEPLNTELKDYMPMSQHLAEKGVKVLRMGSMVDLQIPDDMHPNVIDYGYNHRTEFGDIYLFANCKFVVAGGTGTMWISAAFGRPVVNTDMYLPNNAFFNTSREGIPNLSIPRKFWQIDEKRFLTYGEAFKVFRRYQSAHNCTADGIENIPNTDEEITAVVSEMNDRIDGVWETTPEDEKLQSRYRDLHAPRDHAYGCNGFIGTQFLRDNADLIK